MPITTITRDGQPVGICQSAELPSWTAANAGPEPADLAAAGLVAEEREPDCREVSALVAAIAERARLSAEFTFVPFSLSPNAAPTRGVSGSAEPWQSLNWRVTIRRDGRDVLQCRYATGTAWAPANAWSESSQSSRAIKRAAIAAEIETGRRAIPPGPGAGAADVKTGGKPIAPPPVADVLESLARDADVLDAGGFEEWAGNLGFDPDSRRAEAIYRECLDNTLKLSAAIGPAVMAELRLAASFN